MQTATLVNYPEISDPGPTEDPMKWLLSVHSSVRLFVRHLSQERFIADFFYI